MFLHTTRLRNQLDVGFGRRIPADPVKPVAIQMLAAVVGVALVSAVTLPLIIAGA